MATEEHALDAALDTYRQLLGAPLSAEDLYNRGTVRNVRGLFADALRDFDRALALGLDLAELHHNRGIALFHLQQPVQALACVDKALQRVQGDITAVMHNTRGYMLQSLQRMREARQSYQAAVSLQPDLALAQLNLGLANLTLGQWKEGWQGYEWRWSGAHEAEQGRFQRIATPLPQWRGEPVQQGDGILVFAEQGLGDTLQFCRYLRLLQQRFARVSLVCPQPLLRLVQASCESVEVLGEVPLQQGDWQWHCPLMSLPLAFGTTLDTVPAQVPYLHADADAQRHWAQRLQAVATGRPRVGLCWAGAQGLKDDAKRSMALTALRPLWTTEGVAWVSLQKGDAAAQPQQSDGMLHDWTGALHDFADTAALVSQLDLVLTVDTAVAHLAGALGRPVWLLNRFEGEWRWLQGRNDSPWYPSMRLFTQTAPGDWASVVERVAEQLRAAYPAVSFTDNPAT